MFLLRSSPTWAGGPEPPSVDAAAAASCRLSNGCGDIVVFEAFVQFRCAANWAKDNGHQVAVVVSFHLSIWCRYVLNDTHNPTFRVEITSNSNHIDGHGDNRTNFSNAFCVRETRFVNNPTHNQLNRLYYDSL